MLLCYFATCYLLLLATLTTNYLLLSLLTTYYLLLRWIADAIADALELMKDAPLEVILVHYGTRVKDEWLAIQTPKSNGISAQARLDLLPPVPPHVAEDAFSPRLPAYSAAVEANDAASEVFTETTSRA